MTDTPKLKEYMFEFDIGSCDDWELYTCNATSEKQAREFIDNHEGERMGWDPDDEDEGINPENLKLFMSRETTGELGVCDVSVHSYKDTISEVLSDE